jgi:hypothetical protein
MTPTAEFVKQIKQPATTAKKDLSILQELVSMKHALSLIVWIVQIHWQQLEMPEIKDSFWKELEMLAQVDLLTVLNAVMHQLALFATVGLF